MDKRVKQFADAIIPLLSIPEIFPDIDIKDFSKISGELEKLLTHEELHHINGLDCKKFPINIQYVCGLDIIEIDYFDLLKIINKEEEKKEFVCYVQSQLNNSVCGCKNRS